MTGALIAAVGLLNRFATNKVVREEAFNSIGYEWPGKIVRMCLNISQISKLIRHACICALSPSRERPLRGPPECTQSTI